MLTVCAFTRGDAVGLTQALLERLLSIPDEIRLGKTWTIRSIVISLYHLREFVQPSLVRLFHDKVKWSCVIHLSIFER